MEEENSHQSSSVDEWIAKTEEAIRILREKKPKDRLELVAAIEEAVVSVNASTIGWNSWTKSPQVMKQFSEEELQSMWEKLRDFGCDFLEFDLKWTKNLKEKASVKNKDAKENHRRNYIT